MAKAERMADDDTDRKVNLIQRLIEELCRRRSVNHAWGEVKLIMLWQGGHLKEFKLQEEQIVRDPTAFVDDAGTSVVLQK